MVAPVAGPGRDPPTHWLQTERMRLLERLLAHLDAAILERTCVVFDAKDPPRDQPNRFHHCGMTVWFATQYAEADDLLEKLIDAHTAPQTLTVVSSDHRVINAARRRGATSYPSDVWLDALLDDHPLLGWIPKPEQQHSPDDHEADAVSPDEVEDWLRMFKQDDPATD